MKYQFCDERQQQSLTASITEVRKTEIVKGSPAGMQAAGPSNGQTGIQQIQATLLRSCIELPRGLGQLNQVAIIVEAFQRDGSHERIDAYTLLLSPKASSEETFIEIVALILGKD